MKILNRGAFLGMPEGTIFSKGKPMYFESLCVKGESTYFDGGGSDFTYRDLIWFENSGDSDQSRIFDDMVYKAESARIMQSYGRDGCFDEEDLFLVYEKYDLIEMIGIFQENLDVEDLVVLFYGMTPIEIMEMRTFALSKGYKLEDKP